MLNFRLQQCFQAINSSKSTYVAFFRILAEIGSEVKAMSESILKVEMIGPDQSAETEAPKNLKKLSIKYFFVLPLFDVIYGSV